MANQNTTAWTKELEQEVAKLWETHSANQIAALLSSRGHDFSRGAIAGKLSRLGLGIGNKAELHPNTLEVRQRKSRAKPIAIICDTPPLHEMRNLPLLDLEAGMCRFPSNNADDAAGHLFCGRDVVTGKPYCREHCQLAYLPRQVAKSNNIILLGRHRGGIARAA